MTEPKDEEQLPVLAYETPDTERAASSAPTEGMLEARPHDPYAALRYPDFIRYSSGFILSVVGQQMLSVAVGWEIWQRTHSPKALGNVGLVQVLPVILLAIPAGHLADRLDRKRIVAATQVLVAVCSAALAWLSYTMGPVGEVKLSYTSGPIALFYALLFLLAVCRAFNDPARNALLPQLLPIDKFANAVTWNSSGFQVASMVGPMLGGFIIAIMQSHINLTAGAFAIIYALNALTALLFGILVQTINVRAANVPRRTAITLQSLGAGIRFVWQTKIILATITLDLFAVLLGGAVALLPVYASDILHIGPTGLGWMRAAPSIGAFLMALVLAHLPPMKHAGRAMLWSVAGFAAATIVFGISHNVILSLCMLFLIGAFDNISVVVRHTLVQVLTPDAMRGRVSAVNSVFIGSSNELGEFESGYTAHLLDQLRPGAGAKLSVVLGGVGSLLVVALAAWAWPELRRYGALAGAPSNESKSIEPSGDRVIE